MASTLDLYINMSVPASKSLVAGFATLSAAPTVEWVLRDTVTLRLHFLKAVANQRTGVTFDPGAGASIKFGGKLAADYQEEAADFLFYSGSFTRVATDPNDVHFSAELNLNTVEFIAAFEGGAKKIAVKIEAEITESGKIQTVMQADTDGIYDVITGSEGPPSGAVPPYPAAPEAESLLGGNADSTAWAWYSLDTFARTTGATDVDGGKIMADSLSFGLDKSIFLGSGSTMLVRSGATVEVSAGAKLLMVALTDLVQASSPSNTPLFRFDGDDVYLDLVIGGITKTISLGTAV